MEWVETTGKSLMEAQDLALDQLGVAADEAEFEVLEEPKSGLFGRVRGEARVRARVKPTAVRPKQDRRTRGRERKAGAKKSGGSRSNGRSNDRGADDSSTSSDESTSTESGDTAAQPERDRPSRQRNRPNQNKEQRVERERPQSDVTPQEVGEAAVAFMTQLATAFGVEDATTELDVDGTELEVRVHGTELGLMVGPGGRTLAAVQDIARVAAQRRLGDHETRLRIDVGDYRKKRKLALEQFTATVAQQVIDSGAAKALEPMASNDRKIVHDAVIEIDGVTSHSEGDDPRRRVVITPE